MVGLHTGETLKNRTMRKEDSHMVNPKLHREETQSEDPGTDTGDDILRKL